MGNSNNRIIFWLSITLISIFISACRTTKYKYAGTYHSHFAVAGFFKTRLKLNADNTFNYEWGGDLMHDQASGRYFVKTDTIILRYNPDSLLNRHVESDAQGQLNANALEEMHSANRPPKLLCKHGKLWRLDKSNKRVTEKVFGAGIHKKYWIWGSYYYKRRVYLRKVK